MNEGRNPPSFRIYVVGAAVFAVLMALSGRYGFHRDELYMLQCGEHLQASYVDQPVLAPLLARVSFAVFGLSPTALRWWAALASATTVVVGGLTAREFGGGRRAQLLAAVAVATMPVLLASAHVANTTPLMMLGEASLGLITARSGRTGDTRWWLAAGAVAGIGAEDNHLVGILAVALVIGALASGVRPDRWLAAGAAIAVALMAPDIWWQATHDWAAFAMTHALNVRDGGPAGVVAWIVGQLGLTVLAVVWIWPAGLRFLWRSGRPMWRAIPWAYGLLFLVYMLTTGKQIYYLGGVYVTLLAAGMVAVDGWLRARPARLPRLAAVTAITTAWAALVTLPLLPPSDIGWTYQLSAVNGETIGWPQLVGTVRAAWLSIPAAQRGDAVIFTGNYSEAAAINELGRGLPRAVSGHNTYWWWGPGNPRATIMLIVAQGDANLTRYCGGVRMMATITNPYGVHNIEEGGHVYLCTGLREPLGRLWPRLRHYD